MKISVSLGRNHKGCFSYIRTSAFNLVSSPVRVRPICDWAHYCSRYFQCMRNRYTQFPLSLFSCCSWWHGVQVANVYTRIFKLSPPRETLIRASKLTHISEELHEIVCCMASQRYGCQQLLCFALCALCWHVYVTLNQRMYMRARFVWVWVQAEGYMKENEENEEEAGGWGWRRKRKSYIYAAVP